MTMPRPTRRVPHTPLWRRQHEICEKQRPAFLGLYTRAYWVFQRYSRLTEKSKLLRLIDIAFALSGLIVFSPVLVALFFVCLLDTGQPLFFQRRVGQNCRLFTLIKFRTMKPGTPEVGTHMANMAAVTPWGRILRRAKLDELPQLWNVLRGEMSLVGPRPCLPTQDELIRERQKLGVFSARPGITGLGQILGVDMSDPRRLARLDAELISKLDCRMYFRCLVATLRGQGLGDRLKSP